MLAVALGKVFVKRYAEQFGKTRGNERGEVSGLMATLGRGNDAPVAGGERMTEDLPDKGIHALGKFFHHIGVGLDVGKGAPVDRFLP